MNTTKKNLSILICTAQRPLFLQDLLDSIADANKNDQHFNIDIVLVDNDPLKSAAYTAQQFAKLAPIPMIYILEPVANISRARNRAIDATKEELCLFLDDDQLIGENFFSQLEQSLAKAPFDFTAIRLAIDWKFETELPQWLELGISGPPRSTQPQHLASLKRTDMGTGGLLFRKSKLTSLERSLPGPFDEDLGKSGGEDVDLFLRATASGRSFFYATAPKVSERVPASRATFRYGCFTAIRKGFVDSKLNLRNSSFFFQMTQPIKSALLLTLAILLWPIKTAMRPMLWYQNLLLIFRQIGKIKACVNKDHSHYSPNSKKAKILHLTGGGQDGGAEKIIEQISSHSERNQTGLCFFFYDTVGKRNFSNTIVENGHPAVFYKKSSSIDLTLWYRLISFARLQKATIIHTHDIGAMLHASVAKLFLPAIKLIHTEHTLHYWIDSSKYRRLYRFLSWSFSYIAGVSNYVKSELESKVKVSTSILKVVPNGVDIGRFASKKTVSSSLNKDEFTLVAISRIDANKNLERVISGIALARKRGIPVSLVHVGTGTPEDVKKITNLVETMQLTTAVNLVGYQTDVAPFLAAADCFVSASKVECHPVSVLEAMAGGTPCILSDIAPHKELSQSGIVLFGDSDAALANAIECIYQQRNSYPQFAQSLSKSTSTLFSMPVMLARYSSLYGSL